LVFVLVALLAPAACSPLYVIRAGWAQVGILRSREPLTEVMTDPSTDAATRAKLRLAWDARHFAVEDLGFQNVGESYTSFAQLESDTLAMVLSAAYVDRLELRTWWFPIVGRLPYRAYFSLEGGLEAERDLAEEGFDTYLRPTAAFSTLGWFADPLYSTILARDHVEVVTTVLHELAHNHLYVPGQGRFNESFATFVGHTAAVLFFCPEGDGGPVTVRCERARNRWADAQDISRFVDGLESDVLVLYTEHRASGQGVTQELLGERQATFDAARADFVGRVQPALRASSYGFFATEPLNNATLLARSLYYHRLPEFDALLQSWDGDYAELLAWLRSTAPELQDPFEVLDQD
jgi:predicted aminopeptidase